LPPPRPLAAVSHDLRTPITSLRLLTDAIGDGVVPAAERGEYLARMRVHLDALSALIDDLFELSRLEAGEITWSMQKVDLGMLVSETVDAMSPQAKAGGVAVRCRIPADLEPARADPERLQRVLFNLIQNAIRHTPADGSVTVVAESVSDGVEIEVADTGEGIAPADQDSVFEAFFQGGRRAARSEGGAGLGLAISRAIVEAHGGRIWLADAERGTCVRFRLAS
jgi:signal transduction histidine kinase